MLLCILPRVSPHPTSVLTPRVCGRVRAGAITAVCMLSSITAHAQLTAPAVATFSTVASTRPISASEAAHHVWLKEWRLKKENQMVHSPDYPLDSIRAAVAASARAWLPRIQRSPIQGMQHDPAGRLAVKADQEAYAKQQIAERLATRGLSFSDRAYTYVAAVDAFSDVTHPEKLPQAEAYLNQLDALGDSAVFWRYQARAVLVSAYYLLGRDADIVRLGTSAIALGSRIPFVDRGVLTAVYPATAEALAGQPGGAAKIAALNKELLRALVASPADIAYEASFAKKSADFVKDAKTMIKVYELLGTQAAPIVAQFWINRPKSDSATIPVADGKIRVLEVSDYGCGACLAAIDRIERLHRRFPDVEVMFVTTTLGSWKNRMVEPAEENQLLADFFVNYRKVTFPVGIWTRRRIPNNQGGMSYDDSDMGPNEQAYPHLARPTFWVIDGKGTIRYFVTGQSDNLEELLSRKVASVQREANGALASGSAASR
jgi:hypothetical protein